MFLHSKFMYFLFLLTNFHVFFSFLKSCVFILVINFYKFQVSKIIIVKCNNSKKKVLYGITST